MSFDGERLIIYSTENCPGVVVHISPESDLDDHGRASMAELIINAGNCLGTPSASIIPPGGVQVVGPNIMNRPPLPPSTEHTTQFPHRLIPNQSQN